MDIFRGDTFEFDFDAKFTDGETYIFKPGDTLKVGVKQKLSNTNYILFQKIDIEEETDTVTVIFSHEEMQKCCKGDKILEVELTHKNGTVRTLYQNKITILEDVIDE